MKIWIDGTLYDRSEARVPVFDHGLLYGDGVFEGIRSYEGKPFRLEAHLERLAHGARALHLTLPGGIPRMREAVLATLQARGEPDAYPIFKRSAADRPGLRTAF